MLLCGRGDRFVGVRRFVVLHVVGRMRQRIRGDRDQSPRRDDVPEHERDDLAQAQKRILQRIVETEYP